ncbi:MAG: DHA2 family efflux MFS transporter permease subunit [Pseudomonadota bacterium]
MSSDAADAHWSAERSAAGPHNPWLITIILSLATFMEVLDTSVANIALGHIGGSLSASYDEATWILTSYLVANAIAVPLSGWFAEALGRKRYYMISVALFTAASLACAFAPSIGWLIAFRVAQGIGGGGLAPCEQSMLVDTFPPSQRARAISIYGLVLILGPALGPTIGGVIAEIASWRWLFLINIPVGLASLALVAWLVCEPEALRIERTKRQASAISLDGAGIALIALGLGSLQFVIDRGQRSDWFDSSVIRAFALVAAVSLVLLCVRELRRPNPILNLRLFGDRAFVSASALMLITGALLYATTQIVPQFMQQVMGYSPAWAGLAMTASSVATVLSTILTAAAASRYPAWRLIGLGLIVEAIGLAHSTLIASDMDFWTIALDRVWLVSGLPLILVPLTTGAYSSLSAKATGQASGFLNLFRNIGGAMGIALAQTVLARRFPVHAAQLTERVSLLDPRWRFARQLAPSGLGTLYQHGPLSAERGLRLLFGELDRQALVLAYIDVFWLLAAVAIAALVLAPLQRVSLTKVGGQVEANHGDSI